MAARSLLESLRDRAVEGRIPSWLLGAALALLTWRATFVAPAPGLDDSWQTGLGMAVEQGLQFGTEVIFTYGPLGFLRAPEVSQGDLAVIAFCYAALLYLAIAVSLVWALRRTLPTGAAVVAAYFILALLPGIDQPIALAAILGLGMLGRERPPLPTNAFVLLAASLAAIETLNKISVGPLVLVIAMIALIGARARWWQVGALLGVFAAEVLLLWVLAGQSLSNLPDFIRNGVEIASGYNEAMATRLTSSLWSLVAVLAPLAVVAAAMAGSYRDRLARWAGVALVAAAAALLFKQGIVRFRPDHMAIWISTAAVLWIAIPWGAARRAGMVSGAVVLSAIAIHTVPPVGTGVDAIGHLKFARDQIELLLSPSQRREMEDEARASMQQIYALEPEILAELRGRPVSIDPWEIGVAWAYELDWSPLPVFQNYSAYTERLDELNAAEITDPAGPQRILRQRAAVDPAFPTGSIDGRHPAWDPPAQALATLCHFAPLSTTDRWQVLGRTANRCGEPRQIGTVESRFDEPVEVPAPGAREVVLARVHGVEIDGLERIRATLWRPRSRYLIVNGETAPGNYTGYRVVPGTAAQGLMLRAAGGVAGRGPFSPAPQARTVELTGSSGELRFEFFAIRVRR